MADESKKPDARSAALDKAINQAVKEELKSKGLEGNKTDSLVVAAGKGAIKGHEKEYGLLIGTLPIVMPGVLPELTRVDGDIIMALIRQLDAAKARTFRKMRVRVQGGIFLAGTEEDLLGGVKAALKSSAAQKIIADYESSRPLPPK